MEKVLQQLAGEIAALRREVNKLKLMEVPAITVWTDWEPTVTQSGSVAVTVTYARYTIIQNKVTLEVRLAVTGSGTTANAITISSLPANIANTANGTKGTCRITDTGTATYIGTTIASSDTQLQFTEANTGALIGVSPGFGLASGDVISFECDYEKA